MEKKKIIIGLTGGSGSGKSTILELLSQRGALVIDADKVARDVVVPEKMAYLEIVSHFGNGILLKDKTIDRKKLADIVFSDKNELCVLNEITHKYIKEEIKKSVINSKKSLIVIEAAVLFESGINKMCDYTVGVLSQYEKRLRRIMCRDNLSRAQAENRLSAQNSDEFFIQTCDFIIRNDDDLVGLESELNKIIESIGDR